MEEQRPPLQPRCIASTSATRSAGVSESIRNDGVQTFDKNVQWTPDGTCLIANGDDNNLRTYVLPVDLLANRTLHALSPYSVLPSPEPVHAFVIYPQHELSSPSTTLALCSVRDHPIRLTNTLHSGILASYPLIHTTTERYITPHSLRFIRDGSHFIAGSDSLLSIFDLSRNGEGPITRHATIPSRRKKIVLGGVGMKGIVLALGISCEGLLAAGTHTRAIGLYSDEGEGDTIAVFSVAGEEGDDQDGSIGGRGVTQCLWSPCGRYLYVVERQSDGVLVYDVRVTGQRLGRLRGRKAMTNQRMGVDVVATAEEGGHEIWAGGTDGMVRVWKNPHQSEGMMDPALEWKGHEGLCPPGNDELQGRITDSLHSVDAVSSTVFHPTANIFATSSGQRHDPVAIDSIFDSNAKGDEVSSGISSSDSQPQKQDYSLRVWTL